MEAILLLALIAAIGMLIIPYTLGEATKDSLKTKMVNVDSEQFESGDSLVSVESKDIQVLTSSWVEVASPLTQKQASRL